MDEFYDYNFLCHHGIKGMKWGVRRYQNLDGSLTSAGKARYGSGNSEKSKLKWLSKETGILETRKDMLGEERNGALWIPNKGSHGVWGPTEYVAGLEPDKNIKRQAELLEKVKKGLEDKYKSKAEQLSKEIERYYKMLDNPANDSSTLVAGTKMANALDDLNYMIKQSYIAFPTEYSNLSTEFDPGKYVANFVSFSSNSTANKNIFYDGEKFVDRLGTAGTTGKSKQRIKMPTKERPMTLPPSSVKHSITFNEQNYLCHYGVLGMKWGIRRYQNEDGSLTSEGIQRYGSKHGLKKSIRKANKQLKRLGKAYESSRAKSDKAREMTKTMREDFENRVRNGESITDKEWKNYRAANKTINIADFATSIYESKYKETYNKVVKEFGKESIKNIPTNGKLEKEAKKWFKTVYNVQKKVS